MTGSEKKFDILIVEDSRTQAQLLAYLIESNGYSLTIVNNAGEALDYIRKNSTSLVISDVVMPGMNGYELCSAIRNDELTVSIPVILLTSLTSPSDIIAALECGADDFISKPYNPDFMILKLEKFYNQYSDKNNYKNSNDKDNNSFEEVTYFGKNYRISANKQKMLDLMISAYEAAVHKNTELTQTQDALVNANRQLEITVKDKQAALEDVSLKEELLKKWNNELKIMYRLGAIINQSPSLEDMISGVSGELVKTGLSGTRYGAEFSFVDENGNLIDFNKLPECDESGSFVNKGKSKKVFHDLKDQKQLLMITECRDPECCSSVKRKNISSHGHVYILLLARERSIGLLNLITENESEPEANVSEMLVSLGKQLGMAIENHNLFSETKRLSLHDPLTGLANRRMIDITLENQIARANRYGHLFSLAVIDIDHFKQYNDNFGHDEGDRILVALSTYLKENIRDTDLASRFGGEEFILIISEIGIGEISLIVERHRQLIQDRLGITVSIGVAEYKINQTSEDVIKSADEALYRAKENGRNRVEISE